MPVHCLLAQVFEQAWLGFNCKRDFLLPLEALQDRSPWLSIRQEEKEESPTKDR